MKTALLLHDAFFIVNMVFRYIIFFPSTDSLIFSSAQNMTYCILLKLSRNVPAWFTFTFLEVWIKFKINF